MDWNLWVGIKYASSVFVCYERDAQALSPKTSFEKYVKLFFYEFLISFLYDLSEVFNVLSAAKL